MLAVKTLTHKTIIFRHEIRLMGNQFEISVVGNDPHWANDRINDAIAEINRVEKLLSAFNDDSNVYEINSNAGIKPVKVDPEIFRLVDRSLQIAELTHGAFDITYYASEKSNSDIENTPVKVAARKTVCTINYKNVILDADMQTVFLKEKGMRIGFGASIKGYAADRARYVLQLQGVSSGVINAGGDLLTWGAQPNDEPWTIATADPAQYKAPYANVNISNMAIATSVNHELLTAVINKSQINVINTKKGFAVSGIKSVSILSTSAEFADAMATAVMSIGINGGLYLINQLNQIACVIIDDHDRIYTSKDVSI